VLIEQAPTFLVGTSIEEVHGVRISGTFIAAKRAASRVCGFANCLPRISEGFAHLVWEIDLRTFQKDVVRVASGRTLCSYC
jgi:hypothetical protein